MPPATGAHAFSDDERQTRRADRRELRLVEDGGRPPKRAQPTTGERRTVVITGQPIAARRRSSKAATQIQARPDRIALWAVLLGLFLVFMAVVTANASPV